MKKFPGKLTKQGCKYVLTEEQRSWLTRWFPTVENGRLLEATGMSHSTLHRFARDLGLKKSEKGMHAIMKRQGQKAKATCENNGWYDSIRGKCPSAATIAGSKRMWQEIREGKRDTPYRVMRRKSPKRYRECMARKSEARKELIRSERRRALFGLDRKTRLNVPVDCYTSRQANHRYNALRRGYFVMADCSEGSGERFNIYFDEETERSERFERNLKADGFRVVAYQ